MADAAKGTDDAHLREETVSQERVWQGHFLDVRRATVSLPSGTQATREYIVHPGAVMVIPILDDGRLVMERQYRYPMQRVMLEFPAGKIDPGEPPFTTAVRELAEETGYRAATLRPLTSIWTTPGFTDEVIHLFLATGLTPGDSALEHDEVLDLHPTRWSEALQMVHNGTIRDVKTLTALLFVQGFVRQP